MTLTKSEEQLMGYLWNLEKAFFKDLKEQYPDPKPATTTINTVIKRLIEKKFIDFKIYGNSRQYTSIVSKKEYFSNYIQKMIKGFFNDSLLQFGSFFATELDLNERELLKLKKIIDVKLQKKK